MSKTAKRMSEEEYANAREFYRLKALSEFEKGNESEGEYAVGVVRGLDLAFKDGSAKVLWN